MSKQKLEFEIVGNIGDFTKDVREAKGDIAQLAEAAKKSLNSLPSKGNLTKEMLAARKEAERYLRALEKIQAVGKTSTSQLTPRQQSTLRGKELTYVGALKEAKPSTIDTGATKKRTAEEKALAAAEREREKTERNLAKATSATEKAEITAGKAMNNRNITMRYALYDIASASRQASDALLTYASSIFQAGFAQQQSFSQVEKTQVGVDPKQLDALFKSLQNLSTEIPVTFDELSKLSMLGAQLGIKTDSLDKFTATVAKFSTVTGVTIEDAALKFGKLSTLLDVPAEQFDKLASSIAYVGVNGAATEAAILSTAQQIAAVANAAGFSKDEVIGLASAFASLGIAPEEARSVLIPTMNLIDKSVNSYSESLKRGNETLGTFAAVAGMTADEFRTKWSDKTGGGAGQVFKAFVAGLGSDQVKISSVLAQLGLDGNRTSKGLTALGNNAEFVFQQMKDAATGMENGFLSDSFAKTIDDINKKLVMLDASMQNLMASAGSNPAILAVLGAAIDAVKAFNVETKKILDSSPTLSFLIGLSVAAVGLTGAILGLISVVALARAGFLAIQTAFFIGTGAANTLSGSLLLLAGRFLGIAPPAAAAAAGVSAMTASEVALTVGSRIAAGAVTLLNVALRAIPIIAIVGGLMWLIDSTIKLANANTESKDTSKEDAAAKKAQRDAIKQLSAEVKDNIDMALEASDANLKLQSALFNLGKGAKDAKNNFDIMTSAGQTNMGNLRSVIDAMTASAGQDTKLLAANLIGLRDALILAGVTAGPAMQMIETAIAGTGETVAGVVFDITAFNNGLKDVPSSAGTAKTALEKLMEVLDKLFARSNNKSDLQSSLDALGSSFGENGKKFGYGTKGMVANVQALKDVIKSLATSSGGNVKVFAGNLLSLRSALSKMGITGGEAFNLINLALKKLKVNGKSDAKSIAAIYGTINNALLTQQADNIRTISDYVSDLQGVLEKAFSNRYGSEAARDSITSIFTSISEAADAAKKSIEEANLEIQGLKADKNILEYQLKVAVKYGDTLRADAIRAKLAENEKKTVEQQANIAKAQEATNKTLVGNSAAAVENRAKIRELIQAGNSYLLTLAQSGASSETLKDEAKKLSDEFLLQGKNLGFAETELQTYLTAFTGDFNNVVNSVKKDITLNVVTDPALNAINEFVAKANTALSNLTIPNIGDIKTSTSGGTSGNSSNGSGGTPSKTTTTIPGTLSETNRGTVVVLPKPTAAVLKTYKDYKSQTKTYEAGQGWWITPSAYKTGKKYVADFIAKYGAGYSTGGFVAGAGSATSDSIPAMLSNGEYVLQANAVKYYGTDFMNSLNQMQVQRQSANAASSSSVVYLSPEDRSLLRAAADRPITLYTENAKIAQSANAGNIVLAQRGSN